MTTTVTIEYHRVPLSVDLDVTPYLPATHDSPSEGGAEIEDVRVTWGEESLSIIPLLSQRDIDAICWEAARKLNEREPADEQE